jgi:signal peptidase II
MSEKTESPHPFGRLTYVLGFLVIAASTLAADLGTKAWATRALGSPKTLLPFVSLVYRENRGIAASMFEAWPDAIKVPLLGVATLLAIAFLVVLFARNRANAAIRIGAPLVAGGALGNLVERLHHHYVVDFIDMHARWSGRLLQWPVFNVADIAIVVGLALIFLARSSTTSAYRPSLSRS